LGKEFANNLKYREDGATILALIGELGSGKTTFIQGLAKGLGIKKRIISPTFILVRKYKLDGSKSRTAFSNFYHVDLYRLERRVSDELESLGLFEVWQDAESIVAIEWAEKAGRVLPTKTIWLRFENLGEDKRKIMIKGV
jgi:tRNA threonylcarbamoyladenosine biosynthesis protein TsaE